MKRDRASVADRIMLVSALIGIGLIVGGYTIKPSLDPEASLSPGRFVDAGGSLSGLVAVVGIARILRSPVPVKRKMLPMATWLGLLGALAWFVAPVVSQAAPTAGFPALEGVPPSYLWNGPASLTAPVLASVTTT